MGELIAPIDGTTGHLGGDRKGLTSAYRNYNLNGCDAADLVEFVTVTSDFYPEIQAYYEEEAGEWLAKIEAGRSGRIASWPPQRSSYEHWLPGVPCRSTRHCVGQR